MQSDMGLSEGPPQGIAFLRGLATEDAEVLARWLASCEFTHDHSTWLHRQGLAPFAFYHLKQIGLLNQLPVAEQATLRATFLQTMAANLLALGEARAWAKHFAEADIPAIWLKGVPLSLAVYPTASVRPMGDIDVLIPQVQVKQVLALLKSVTGASPAYLSLRTDTEARVRLGPYGQVMMEVHWDLVRPLHLRRRSDLDWFFHQQQTIVNEGVALQSLQPEAHLLYICAHAEINHRGVLGLRHYFDLHRLITQTPGFDWDIVMRRVAALGWAQAVARGLTVSAEAFDTPLPANILTELQQLRSTHETSLHAISRRVAGNRWTSMSGYLGTLGWRDRLYSALALVFPPPAYMRWRYHLRRGWQAPFYYPYRWFDVLRERARAQRRSE